MAVVVETTLGDITIDLYTKERPRACLNFLKLCKIKYYNFNLFHTVNQGFIAQTGDPTGSRNGGESIWGVMHGPLKRYFEAEDTPRIKHTSVGLVSFVGDKNNMIGSQFFITLSPDLTYLDAQHCVFGEVTEGFEVLRALNEAICDSDHRPYQDIRITHTVVLEDPFPDPEELKVPDASPEPTAERLQGGRIAPDEEIDETAGKSAQEVAEHVAQQEAKARATILEMIGDIPDAEMAPPENVLFVCKLNPITTDDDLEIIFSRFGKIKSCEVIRDKKTGDSLQYAFVEFEDQKSCEDAYFKMDNVLIDDRRIHVDFSQSVAKIRWLGKGRGVAHYNDKGERQKGDPKNDIGNGKYEENKREKQYDNGNSSRDKYKNEREKNYPTEHRSERYNKNEYERSKRRDYDYYKKPDFGKRNRADFRTDTRRDDYRNDSRKNWDNYRYESRRNKTEFRDDSRRYRDDYKDESRRYRDDSREEIRRNRDDSRDASHQRHRSTSRERQRASNETRKDLESYKKEKYNKTNTSSSHHKTKTEKKNKHSSSSESSSDEEEKKTRKTKNKKSKKKKKKASKESESDSDSESSVEVRKSKKKKRKKNHTSSESDEDDEPRKRKSRK